LTRIEDLTYLSWLEVEASKSIVLTECVRGGRILAAQCGGHDVTEKEPNRVTGWRQIGLLSSIPFILALAPIVGYFLGDYLDKKFGTGPWLQFTLLGLGFVAGVRETIKIVKMSQRED
jgi:hypothetical protein